MNRWWGMLTGLAVVCLVEVVWAQRSEPVTEAKRLFDAGAAAYASGQYTVAIQAFEQAYDLSPRAGVMFSLAQAYRRQYYIEKDAELLRRAIENYRAYLRIVERGGRRSDAAQALAELEVLANRQPPSPSAAPAPKPPTRLMVTSLTQRATVNLDGAPAVACPLIAKVGAGRHWVRVQANGYGEVRREVVAVEGALVVVEVNLREKPSLIDVVGDTGALLSVDGAVVGVTPMATSIEVEPGRHVFRVVKNGYQPVEMELNLGREERRLWSFRLVPTGQRLSSYALLSVGAASMATSGVLALLAWNAQSSAQDIEAARGQGNITATQLSDYARYVERRDEYRSGAWVAGGIGLGLGVVGAGLYLLDGAGWSGAIRKRSAVAQAGGWLWDEGGRVGMGSVERGVGIAVRF